MTPDQFVICIGQVESGNDPNVTPGDKGRAMGRFQVHPEWWDEWAYRYAIKAETGMTWDAWVAEVVRAFFTEHSNVPTLDLAMYWHLGHPATASAGDWDHEYAAKFTIAAAGIGAAL